METASAIEQRDVNRVKLTKALAALDKAEKALFGGLTVCRMCSVNPTAYENEIQLALTAIREAKDQSK
jgi:hypothetical protein